MAQELNQKLGFNPLHSAHAIERVAFTVQFDRLIDDENFKLARSVLDKYEVELPGEADIQALVLGVPQHFSAVGAGDQGFLRRKMNPDGSLESELLIERASITFVTTKYLRWADIWVQAAKYLEELVPIFLKSNGVNLAAVGLNYIDKFLWNGKREDCNLRELVDVNSKYISTHIFETSEFSHNHTGVFIKYDHQTRRLLNLNLDFLDEKIKGDIKQVVRITTTLTDQFNQIGYERCNAEDVTNKLIAEHMVKMHEFGKKVFKDLITTDMANRIALEG